MHGTENLKLQLFEKHAFFLRHTVFEKIATQNGTYSFNYTGNLPKIIKIQL
jgi:hypothetical protein